MVDFGRNLKAGSFKSQAVLLAISIYQISRGNKLFTASSLFCSILDL